MYKRQFVALGASREDAAICADVLIAADLRGVLSHGIGRLKYYYDRIVAGVQFTTRESEICLLYTSRCV